MRSHSSTGQGKGQSHFAAWSRMPPEAMYQCPLVKFPAAFARGIIDLGEPSWSLASPDLPRPCFGPGGMARTGSWAGEGEREGKHATCDVAGVVERH